MPSASARPGPRKLSRGACRAGTATSSWPSRPPGCLPLLLAARPGRPAAPGQRRERERRRGGGPPPCSAAPSFEASIACRRGRALLLAVVVGDAGNPRFGSYDSVAGVGPVEPKASFHALHVLMSPYKIAVGSSGGGDSIGQQPPWAAAAGAGPGAGRRFCGGGGSSRAQQQLPLQFLSFRPDALELASSRAASSTCAWRSASILEVVSFRLAASAAKLWRRPRGHVGRGPTTVSSFSAATKPCYTNAAGLRRRPRRPPPFLFPLPRRRPRDHVRGDRLELAAI